MDRYTKTILTVIAGCLLVQTADKIVTPAHANTNRIAAVLERMIESPQKVVICDVSGQSCARGWKHADW